jgi:hypothetical protein
VQSPGDGLLLIYRALLIVNYWYSALLMVYFGCAALMMVYCWCADSWWWYTLDMQSPADGIATRFATDAKSAR